MLRVAIVIQLAQQGVGVGHAQIAGRRVAAGAIGQNAAQALFREAEIAQDLADQVSHVEHHAAAGAARDRRDDKDPRCGLAEGQARLLGRGRHAFRDPPRP